MYLIIVGSWALLSNLIPMLFLIGGQNRFDEDNLHCCIVTHGSPVWTAIYWLMIIVPLMGCCNGVMAYCNIRIFQHLRDHVAVQKLEINVVKQNRELLYLLAVDMRLPLATHTVYHVTKFAFSGRQILFFLNNKNFSTAYVSIFAIR
jgi:hypothetical protein